MRFEINVRHEHQTGPHRWTFEWIDPYSALADEYRTHQPPPSYYSKRIVATGQELEECEAVRLAYLHNWRAAFERDDYDYTDACPLCGLGRKLKRSGLKTSLLRNRPIQVLSSGEYILRRDVIEGAVERGLEFSLIVGKQCQVRPVRTNDDLEGVGRFAILAPLADQEMIEILNRPFLAWPGTELHCEAGHSFSPEGVLRIRRSQMPKSYAFTVQAFGGWSGVLAPARHLIMNKSWFRLLNPLMKGDPYQTLDPVLLD